MGEGKAVIFGWQYPDSLLMPPDVLLNLSFPTPRVLLAEGGAHLQPQKSKTAASPPPALGQPQTGVDLSWASQMLQPKIRGLQRHLRAGEGYRKSSWEASSQAGEHMVSDESPENLQITPPPF